MTIVDGQYIRRNPVGPLGRRVIAHAQAAADKRRAERRARIKIVMAQRLAEIQATQAQRQRKGKR